MTKVVKLFGTKWMGNGNGGRVTRPTSRVKHRGFPKTGLSAQQICSDEDRNIQHQ
jgi:hypothetical protein